MTAAALASTRLAMRWIMAAFFLLAGIGHFAVLDKVVQASASQNGHMTGDLMA